MAIQTLCRPKKRSEQTSHHSGSIPIEQNDYVPELQNVISSGGAQESTSGSFYVQHRPERWVLARPSYPQITDIPRFQVQTKDVPIQSHAFWSQHSTTHVHESHVRGYETRCRGGSLGPPVPGRYSYSVGISGSEPPRYADGPKDFSRPGVFDKPHKIQTFASPKISVAGDQLGPGSQPIVRHSPGNLDQVFRPPSPSLRLTTNEETGHASAGASKMDGQRGSLPQTFHLLDKENPASNNPVVQELACSTLQAHASKTAPVEKLYSNSNTIGSTGSGFYSNDGCIPQGMGHRIGGGEIFRAFSPNDVLLNQCERTLGSVDGSLIDRQRESFHPNISRQYPSYLHHQERLRQNFSSPFPRGSYTKKNTKQETDPGSETHPGIVQCPIGPALSQHHHFDGMVSPTNDLQQQNPEKISSPQMGHVRHVPEQEASEICVSVSRYRSKGHRRANDGLVPHGGTIHVSPHSSNFEGGGEMARVETQDNCVSHGILASQTLVCQTIEDQQNVLQNLNSPSTSSGEHYRVPDVSYRTPRLEFMKVALRDTFPGEEEIIQFLVSTIRPSSAKDYQTKFSLFMNFLRTNAIALQDLKLINVLQFLMFLFRNRRSARTIYSYRSALSKPLKWYFNIDLMSPYVSDLLKAMVLQRPRQPPKELSWDVKELLSFVEEFALDQDETNRAAITGILLLLATGWRISELHACVRDAEFLSIDTQNILKIRPHKAFLAKNELPNNRWGHVTIKPLFLQDGRRSNLCPVLNLQQYLTSTSRMKKGPLFIQSLSNEPTPLHTISRLICNFIKRACPGASPGAHDLRKVAASLALVDCMNLSFVTSTMNWSSTTTFIKHYLLQTPTLSVPIATPGRR